VRSGMSSTSARPTPCNLAFLSSLVYLALALAPRPGPWPLAPCNLVFLSSLVYLEYPSSHLQGRVAHGWSITRMIA